MPCDFCGCCPGYRPRYKRLVDNIFPVDPRDGIQKNNMEKLTFYVLSSPSKLDRVGDYLAIKISGFLYRRRTGFIIIAMEAMDRILYECRTHSLNPFVDSFLHVVQLLLESQDPNIQLLAVQSFEKFANIEEDTPSYHRRYDFFFSKFASLCHSNNDNKKSRKMLKVAGLRGIKGLVKKTVSDELQTDVWDEIYMGKIVPSLLYNMKEKEEESYKLAEEILILLMENANFDAARSVIRPVLNYLDDHDQWETTFPSIIFQIIMDAVQKQHSFVVIYLLMNHLDKLGEKSLSKFRTGIVKVLSQIIASAASESFGPSVLETINTLLVHLQASINRNEEEKEFQEAVIHALAEFTNNLPDFQKTAVMIFIIGKVPSTSSKKTSEIRLQDILLKSLLRVSTKYRTINMIQAFPSAFFKPLLAFSLATDPNVRLTVQMIFHQLLDRNLNLENLKKTFSLTPLPDLNMNKSSRQDIMFMRKNGYDLMVHVYENVQFGNNQEANYKAIFTTLALIVVELNSEEVVIKLLRLIFALQDLTNTAKYLSIRQKEWIHAIVAAFLHLIAHLMAIPSFCSHVDSIIKARGLRNPSLLPKGDHTYKIDEDAIDSSKEPSTELLFNKVTIQEALKSSGHDVNNLLTPFLGGHTVDGIGVLGKSATDLNKIELDLEIGEASPEAKRRSNEDVITFESFRKVLMEPLAVEEAKKEERRLATIDRFRNVRLERLIADSQKRVSNWDKKISSVFEKISVVQKEGKEINGWEETPLDVIDVIGEDGEDMRTFSKMNQLIDQSKTGPPLFNVDFPDLFVY